MQVQNGAKVFAKKTGSKSQVGRWKGLDEDVSDDQVIASPPQGSDTTLST